MLKSHALSLLLGAAVLCAPSFAQRGHRNPPDIFQDQTNLPAEASRGPDPEAMLELANELQQLSNSIPGEIEKVAKGTISKDLGARLKRIEKLAKKLREEVVQQ